MEARLLGLDRVAKEPALTQHSLALGQAGVKSAGFNPIDVHPAFKAFSACLAASVGPRCLCHGLCLTNVSGHTDKIQSSWEEVAEFNTSISLTWLGMLGARAQNLHKPSRMETGWLFRHHVQLDHASGHAVEEKQYGLGKFALATVTTSGKIDTLHTGAGHVGFKEGTTSMNIELGHGGQVYAGAVCSGLAMGGCNLIDGKGFDAAVGDAAGVVGQGLEEGAFMVCTGLPAIHATPEHVSVLLPIGLSLLLHSTRRLKVRCLRIPTVCSWGLASPKAPCN